MRPAPPIAAVLLFVAASSPDDLAANPPRAVAAVVTVYRHNSHADIILSRLLQTDTLDGKGNDSPLKLVSLYTDQKPENDTSRMLAASHRFALHDSIRGALTLGTDRLAVDGVLLIAEHGEYPVSETGNTQYPKRRFWDEVFETFRHSGRVVPVFADKHLADNWEDAYYIYETARRMKVPLMAGSSLPTTWRKPAADVRHDARLSEIVALTYGSTDHYGFHALEFVQALAEQRHGGETGIEAVTCLAGDAVWRAQEEGLFSAELFQEAWDRLPRHLNGQQPLREAVTAPLLMRLEYADGLRAHILELNGAVGEWSAAWRYAPADPQAGQIESAQFWTQEGRPGMHFTYLLRGIEAMMISGTPSWPAERTLLSSGALDAALQSRQGGGDRLATPHLLVRYNHPWRWSSPPPPPPARPWNEQ